MKKPKRFHPLSIAMFSLASFSADAAENRFTCQFAPGAFPDFSIIDNAPNKPGFDAETPQTVFLRFSLMTEDSRCTRQLVENLSVSGPKFYYLVDIHLSDSYTRMLYDVIVSSKLLHKGVTIGGVVSYSNDAPNTAGDYFIDHVKINN